MSGIEYTPFSNEFEMREEVIFIEFDRVIKNKDQYLLHLLGGPLYNTYEAYLDLDNLKGIDMYSALPFTAGLTDVNIIRCLAKKEFDYGKAFMDLYDYDEDMFRKCDNLIMQHTVLKTLPQKFCKRIYFWSEVYDSRIENEIRRLYAGSKNLDYVYGNINDVLDSVVKMQPTMYIFGNIDRVLEINTRNDFDYIQILVGNYRFNMIRDEHEDLIWKYPMEVLENDKHIKILKFDSFLFDEMHYSNTLARLNLYNKNTDVE